MRANREDFKISGIIQGAKRCWEVEQGGSVSVGFCKTDTIRDLNESIFSGLVGADISLKCIKEGWGQGEEVGEASKLD